MRPSECDECRKIFMDRPLLQTEMRHLAAKYGPGSAEAELNERLEEEHADHRDKVKP